MIVGQEYVNKSSKCYVRIILLSYARDIFDEGDLCVLRSTGPVKTLYKSDKVHRKNGVLASSNIDHGDDLVVYTIKDKMFACSSKTFLKRFALECDLPLYDSTDGMYVI